MVRCSNWFIPAGDIDFRVNKERDLEWIIDVPDPTLDHLHAIGDAMGSEVQRVLESSLPSDLQISLNQCLEAVKSGCLALLGSYGPAVEGLRASIRKKVGGMQQEKNPIRLHQACYDFWTEEIEAIAVQMMKKSVPIGQTPGNVMPPVIALLRRDPTIAGLYATVIRHIQDTKA